MLLNLYRVMGDVNNVAEIEDPSDYYIMDCRKTIAATANSALGKGVEDEKNYERTKVVFLDIENIHVMRSSLRLVEEALLTGMDDAHGWFLISLQVAMDPLWKAEKILVF